MSPGSPAAERQALFGVQPIDPLVVHAPALSTAAELPEDLAESLRRFLAERRAR
jgi:hypothetical protein